MTYTTPTPYNGRFSAAGRTGTRMSSLTEEIDRRRTFAIISHPDAGKTTLTEKFLLFGGAIQLAGSVKARKASRHATSDWMEMEKERGISITSSVMQFPYKERIVNLLDTPGHADFSEDTYRVLTAVDSALMVIDCAKGVEERTIKLMEVCRLRTTPIFTFINKLGRECAPVTWPIGMGRRLKGIYHLLKDEIQLFEPGKNYMRQEARIISGLHSAEADEVLGPMAAELRDEIELVKGASHDFDLERYLKGEQTPVFFGSALNNFGVIPLLDEFVEHAPRPQPRPTLGRTVKPEEDKLTGFVFKVQANMDPAHRDRMAFMRVCSGTFTKGMKLHHVRIGKEQRTHGALTFMAAERAEAEQAFPGDIVGLHNHGTIGIGDTLTEGLTQLSEEGATQFFKPLMGNDLVLGAVGVLQFDVVAYRLKSEYNCEAGFENVNVATCRWVSADNERDLEKFRDKNIQHLAEDGGGRLVYLAPTRVNLQLAQERHPEITFRATREVSVYVQGSSG